MSDFKLRSLTFFLIGMLSFVAFFLDLGRVSTHLFDEQRYVSAAKALSSHQTNENWSHPVLAKKIISWFIKYFGDDILGWRLGSVLAGTVTVILISALALLWTNSLFMAVTAAFVTVFNQALFVQSRLANLDSFMIAFMFGAIFISAWMIKKKPQGVTKSSIHFFLIGALWGLANGCKWAAAFPAVFWMVLVAVIYKKSFLRSISLMISGALIFYFLSQITLINMWHPSYAPNIKGDYLIDPAEPAGQTYKAQDLFALQSRMMIAQQKFSRESHPYQSRWYEWPFSNQPVLYYHDQVSIVAFLMNPVILILGLISLIFCFYQGLRTKSPEALFISAAFLSLWLTWVFVPRLTQFTYYFLPAYLIYSLSLAYSLHFFRNKKATLVVLLLVFSAHFYYFDVLTGRPADQDKIEKILGAKNKE